MQNHTEKFVNILLVEDDFILSMDAEETLTANGAKVIAAEEVSTALDIIENIQIDYAIVDYHLGEETSEVIIDKLCKASIPFAIVSGTELKNLQKFIDEKMTIFRKPVDYNWVMRRLSLQN
jgi:ActR/RegA family two-component response regulator